MKKMSQFNGAKKALTSVISEQIVTLGYREILRVYSSLGQQNLNKSAKSGIQLQVIKGSRVPAAHPYPNIPQALAEVCVHVQCKDLPTLIILLLVSRFLTFLTVSRQDSNLTVFGKYHSEMKCWVQSETPYEFLVQSIQPKFQPVRPGRVVHLKSWTSFV